MNIEVYISNISEDVWAFIDTMRDEEKKHEIEENAYLSDRELLTLNPQISSIIIFPVTLDQTFIEYYKNLFNNQSFEVWIPKEHTGTVCLDLQQDEQLWKKLIELGKHNTLVLKSYSASQQFLQLIRALRQAGCSVTTPESPSEEAWWTVNHFGSKSGVRKTTEQLSKESFTKAPWMIEGKIADDISSAVAFACEYYLKYGGVVIKTNKAHSGAGVVIVPPSKLLNNYQKCEAYFKKLFSQEEYWTKFPIIVERFVDIDIYTGGGNPNCEYKINETGEVKLLYICGMRVTSEGIFKGVEIHNNVFDAALTDQLIHYGTQLGKTYFEAGYQGYYDVDCMYTKDGQLLITESNVRRTGGTHVYHTGTRLLGDNFSERCYMLSNNTHGLKEDCNYSFQKIHSLLQPLLFSHQKKEGIILASANILKQHKLSHIIIGKNKESAFAIEGEMERILG